MLLYYEEKFISHKAVYKLVEKFSQGRYKISDEHKSWFPAKCG